MRRAAPVMAILPVRRAGAAVLGVLLAVGGTALTAPAHAAPPTKTAVIVQLTPGSDADAGSRRAAVNGGVSVSHVYTEAFHGFAGSFNERALEGLRRNPRVTLIEADGVATVSDIRIIPSGSGLWGLDRIDDRSTIDGTYVSPAATATTVTTHIVDTRVAVHADLDQRGPRLRRVHSGRRRDERLQRPRNACRRHHARGGEARHGGARPRARLRRFRYWSGVIAGLAWVVADHATGSPAVVNMSLGGSRNSSVDVAVSRVITTA